MSRRRAAADASNSTNEDGEEDEEAPQQEAKGGVTGKIGLAVVSTIVVVLVSRLGAFSSSARPPISTIPPEFAPNQGGSLSPDPRNQAVMLPDPAQVAALYRQGNELFRAGDLKGAEESFRGAVVRDPKHAFAWANLGNALRGGGKTEEAARAFRVAFTLSPSRARSAFNLATSLQALSKHHEARDMFESAIALSTQGDNSGFDSSKAYSNLGVTQQALGKLAEAEVAFSGALSINPSMRSAGLNRCSVLLPLKGMKESAECYESLAEADPSFVEAWSGGAGVRHLDGDYDQAVAMYRKALALRPDDQTSKHLLSAILGGGEGGKGDTPQASVAPEEYVRGIFDGYAGTFEESLAVLRYQSPELIRKALDAWISSAPEARRPAGRHLWRVLDGGCGTGLCGPLLRNISSELVGVDLSDKMLERARQRGVYDKLVSDELVRAVTSEGSRAPLDLVVAADVLVYFGDLAPFLAACRDAVKIGGLITFTTETLISEGGGIEAGVDDVDVGVGKGEDLWQLTVSGRYAHSPTYVIGAGVEAGGLRLIKEEAITPRWNKGKPVQGHLYLFERISSPQGKGEF